MRRHRKGGLGWLPTILAFLLAVAIPATAERDGNGGFALPVNAFSDPVTGGTLTASDADAVWRDIETAIAGSVATDGQSTMSGNLKMGSQRITGLAEGTAATDAVTVNQVQDNAMRWGGVAGGTADALTLTLSPVISAYVDGMTVYFVSGASPNTGATTVSVNSVATDAILKNGSALVAGDIAASKVYAITYYNGDWHLWSPLTDLSVYALKASANTFTAAQTISTTTTGAVATLSSTEAGASEAALDLYRNSASPAASDVPFALNWKGEDSAGNTETYAKDRTVISDPTSTSEDAQREIQTVVAGTLATRVTIGQGVQVGTPTGTDKGTGTLNASAGVYINGHGTIAQVVSDTEATYTTLGTILPVDNSIPQNDEGDEVLSIAITPTNASSKLRITFTGFVGGSTNQNLSCALFVDSTADALNATTAMISNVSLERTTQLAIQHEVTAGSTSARTYKIRCGSSVATDGFLNGTSTGRLFGGVATSTLKVEEVLPQ